MVTIFLAKYIVTIKSNYDNIKILLEHEDNDISLLIKKISEDINKKCNNDLKAWGITLSQVRILGYVKFRQEDGLLTSQKDIENHFEVSHPTVVGVLNNLKEKGLITTSADENDKRIRRVFVTPKENEFHSYITKTTLETNTQLLYGISFEEQQVLLKLLQKIKKNIQKGNNYAQNINKTDKTI